ncbi:hypothetical protein Fmac_019672 [Flemingia macrophylla]|uniref:Inositol oxygenase n=1 Tax=Flemingia macrophylla TaxID=520843 RepID=A0ABD1M8H4_9FABA
MEQPALALDSQFEGKNESHAEESNEETMMLLNEVVDESDPDLHEPQIQHLLQSAEAIRKDYPNEDWLHLTALIHDLGKILTLPQFGGLPQWTVVGDTFPLGCAFDHSNVHHKYFKDNPDYKCPAYNTKNGIYTQACGLDNVLVSWGHDDYMYMVANKNGTTLLSAGLFIIRYHSFYPLHKEGAYTHLMNQQDFENLNLDLEATPSAPSPTPPTAPRARTPSLAHCGQRGGHGEAAAAADVVELLGPDGVGAGGGGFGPLPCALPPSPPVAISASAASPRALCLRSASVTSPRTLASIRLRRLPRALASIRLRRLPRALAFDPPPPPPPRTLSPRIRLRRLPSRPLPLICLRRLPSRPLPPICLGRLPSRVPPCMPPPLPPLTLDRLRRLSLGDIL